MTTLTITNAGQNAIGAALMNGTSCQITWVAIGTGSTSPTTSDTQLVAEVFRLPVTTAVAGASAGEVIITASLAPGQAPSVVIGEVGCFGGPGAGSGANTGTMFGRALYSHTHGSEVINLVFDMTY